MVSEAKTGAKRCTFDQCAFGAATRKTTCVSSTIPGFPSEGPRCRCCSPHQPSRGRTVEGVYRSQRLSAYPSALNEWFAEHLCSLFVKWASSGGGPTGWLSGREPLSRVTNWSSHGLIDKAHGVAFLNEATARSDRVIVSDKNSAFDLHADDGVFMAQDDSVSDKRMHVSANGLVRAGFTVSDRNIATKTR